MEKDRCIVYISLLGDPDVEFGIPGTGGYNKTVRELLDYYSAMPVTVFVITNKNIYNSCSASKLYDNIKINRIDFGVDWESNQELVADNIELIFDNVCKIIESVKLHFEIKLIHSFYWLSGYIASLVKQKYSLPFVHTVISLAEDKLSVGISPHTDKQRQIEDMFLKKADWIFAITPQEKLTLIQKYGISYNKIIIVGRSVNRAFPEVFYKKEQYKNTANEVDNIETVQNDSWWVNGAFLYVGRIVTIKGIKQIITAWIYSKERYNLNIPLWIVGGTPNQIEIMRKNILYDCPGLTEYENDNRIIWWGSLSSADISSLMRKSQALIMHSMFEAGGRVIIEALSAGIPVIATPFGYGKDYVFDSFNGYIVDFGDTNSLSKAMMRFADNPFLSSVMGKAAFTLMRKVHEYKDAGGLWHEDRFRPIVTAAANLVLNLILVNFWGIYGVLLSTVVTALIIGMPWLLHNLFTVLFEKKHLKGYLKKLTSYFLFSVISCVVSVTICHFIPLSGVMQLIVNLVISLFVPNVLFFIAYYKRDEFRSSVALVDSLTKNKLKLRKRLLRGK